MGVEKQECFGDETATLPSLMPNVCGLMLLDYDVHNAPRHDDDFYHGLAFEMFRTLL